MVLMGEYLVVVVVVVVVVADEDFDDVKEVHRKVQNLKVLMVMMSWRKNLASVTEAEEEDDHEGSSGKTLILSLHLFVKLSW